MAPDYDNSSEARTTGSKPWIKPTIVPLRSGSLNKFGKAHDSSWTDAIDNVPVKDLLDQYDSPLFVFSEQRLRRNSQRLKQAFCARYPDVLLAWSYKTNYLGALCNVFHQEGAWAEVVSDFEYEKARGLGVPGERIFFNGPGKKPEALRRAVAEGARIHIDHLDELYALEKITKDLERSLDVTLRLNFDTGYTEPWSRFGFNVESGQAMDAAWRIASSEHMSLTGLHSHIGTFVLEPKAYAVQARIMCNFLDEVESRTDCNIDYLDLGGGFASMNSLQGIYLPADQVVPSVEQYAEAICDVLLELTHDREARGMKRPTLVLETGRALVDDAGYLLTKVIANKRLPDGRRAVIVDAGVGQLFTAFWYNHNVVSTRLLSGRPEETVIYGPLCMNIDVMRASIMLPPLNVGDTLLFTPVGAYNTTQWMQFIEYRPNVLLIHGDKSVSVIRRKENLATVTASELIPEHLVRACPQGDRIGGGDTISVSDAACEK
ncbi:alanine racemase [Congregibacter variabilis]|uniref:Alanine racemase n=1 Tax=Congregibacter variabilis TaxID=3081200 RepID=A0ABZ0I4I4_9GAMM|nr:alanine racemase [Congregibacter sp. IMCC43200]